jgi:two-component system response regulator YesN
MDEPYKMILVDDEDEVRGRISSKISAESGFTVVGTAGNGYDAIDLIEKQSPQVVLTDIKMPYVDGIELAKIIRRDYPTVRVGFITGYNDFDYAREAIEHNVRSYLTKPLTQEDIAAFLRKLKIELDEEFRESYDREVIRRRFEESVPLIIENWFVSVLASGGGESAEDAENFRSYGVSLDDRPYTAVYVRLDRGSVGDGIIDYEKLKLSVRSDLETVLKKQAMDHHGFMFGDGIVFIVKETGAGFSRELDSALSRMVASAERFLGVGVEIGVSSPHLGAGELGAAYEEAASALSLARLSESGRIAYTGRGSAARSSVSLSETDAKAVERILRFGSQGDLEETLAGLREKALAAADAVKDGTADFRPYVLGLVNVFVNYAAALDADIRELLGVDVLEFMTRFRNLDELFRWAADFAVVLRKAGETAKMNNSQRLLASAVAAIEEGFANPEMSMESVCEEQGISVSYLSHLFKKHMDSTFVRFLTKTRMEKAKELLTVTGDRIVEVAAACGYKDVYYFSHSFKKHEGVSPRTYREGAQ